MGFNDLLKTAKKSPIFKDFIKNHPSAVLCAGFFVLDFSTNETKQTIDYMIGNDVFTFSLNENDEIVMAEDKLIEQEGTPKLKEIKPSVLIDIDDLKSTVGIRMLDEGIHTKMQKIIAVLQTYELEESLDKQQLQVWNLTCILDGMQILHVIVDSQSENANIIKFEKKSMMEFIKKEK